MTNVENFENFYKKVSIDLRISYKDFYKLRILNQINYSDLYKDVRILKFPEDLRTYERLIDDSKPEVIIELGVEAGGSSLWFADRLDALCGGGEVIAVDIDISQVQQPVLDDKRITLIEGDISSPEVVNKVKKLVSNRRVMIIEDAAHTYDCTLSALQNYWDLVPVDGWFIVEDGIVDIEYLRFHHKLPRGVISALDYFCSSPAGKKFSRNSLAPYGITSNPTGWLQRKSE